MPEIKTSVSSKKERIKALVVEDDRNFCMILQECLSDLEHFAIRKFFTANASDAMQKMRSEKPDLVLLDINLPDGNGLDLIRPMLKIHPAVGIVMVTGSAFPEDVKKGKEDGAIGYILKPYNKHKIADALSKFLEYRARYYSQHFANRSQEESSAHARAHVDFRICGEEK